MAQPSIANYFGTRKRAAADDIKLNNAKKVLILDQDNCKTVLQSLTESCIKPKVKEDNLNNNSEEMLTKISSGREVNKVIFSPIATSTVIRRKITPAKGKKAQVIAKHGPIERLLNNMNKNVVDEIVTNAVEIELKQDEKKETVLQCDSTTYVEEEKVAKQFLQPTTPTKSVNVNKLAVEEETKGIVQPKTPKKCLNIMNKLNGKGTEPTFSELKQKLSRSSRLAELKASLARLQQSDKKLQEAEKKTEKTKETLSLKNFKAIELEVNLSPQKVQSPEKAYLSPKKDTTARKSLFNLRSPTKNAVPMPASPSKHQLIEPIRKESLALPYKYRCLAEIFRAIDTVCQILYNRKETITFKKLKPAVEEMLKRNLLEKHLAQLKFLYPEAFVLQQEKLRAFGTGTRNEHWELVLIPQVEQQNMTSEVLLERRRKLYKILIEKLKDYHEEFLGTLNPPMEIPRHNITRWHPLFDLEKVPDIEVAELPQAPDQEKFTTGSQVLEKARALFNCNTRMEKALEKLKQSQQSSETAKEEFKPESILKGIPKALLEKVRKKQAAKALESMTRSTAKEKEAQLYSCLPEIARLTRNLFVSEKKNVLPLELVVEKLCHSYRAFSNKNQMEEYLRTIAKEESNWLKFEEVRGIVFVKIAKNHDLSLVMNKLQSLAEQKMT